MSLRINRAANFNGEAFATTIYVDNKFDSISFENLLSTLITATPGYTLPTSVIPEIAITRVFAYDATSAVVGTDTVLGLIKSAITDSEVQTGDVVIISSSDEDTAEAFSGSYIFTSTVAVASITAENYVKMAGGATTSSITVNNQIADANDNITIGWSNIGDGTVSTFTVTSGVVSVNGTELASASVVTSEVAKLTTAVEKAVEVVEGTISISNGATATSLSCAVTTEDGETIVTVTVSGRVMAVYDNLGIIIYPEITYNSATQTSTLVANYGSTTVDSAWIVTYSKAIVVA